MVFEANRLQAEEDVAPEAVSIPSPLHKSESRKEVIKLRANLMNAVAGSLFATGVLTPMITLGIANAGATTPQAIAIVEGAAPFAALLAIVCAAACIVVHIFATRHLSELDK